ncbi:MAG TPA: hypothetical protein VIG74_00610, partial [Alphaproteobacteria bacterium]
MFEGQARRKAVLFSFIFAAMLMAQAGTARAVDATLNIKVRLVKCVSQQERRAMCSSENLCCQYVNGPISGFFRVPDQQLSSLETPSVPSPNAIWISGPERLAQLT